MSDDTVSSGLKWNKYPETKPVEGSGLTLGGCIIQFAVEPYTSEGVEWPQSMGYGRQLAIFDNDCWNLLNEGNLIPLDKERVDVTHYLYLNEIPGPEDEAPQKED